MKTYGALTSFAFSPPLPFHYLSRTGEILTSPTLNHRNHHALSHLFPHLSVLHSLRG